MKEILEELSDEEDETLQPPTPQQQSLRLSQQLKSGSGSLRSSKQSLEYKVASNQNPPARQHIEIFDEVDYDEISRRSGSSSHSEAVRPAYMSGKPSDAVKGKTSYKQSVTSLLSSSSSHSSQGRRA